MLRNSHTLIFPQESLPGTPCTPIYLSAQHKARGLCWSHPCPPRLSGRAGQAVRFSPREGLEHSLSPPTLGTCPYDEQGAEGGDARLPWELAPHPIPLQGCTGALTAHAHQRPLVPGPRQASDLSMNWEQREERRGRKKKRGLYHSCGPSCQGRLAHHQRGSDLLRQMMTHPLQAGQVLPAAGGEPLE